MRVVRIATEHSSTTTSAAAATRIASTSIKGHWREGGRREDEPANVGGLAIRESVRKRGIEPFANHDPSLFGIEENSSMPDRRSEY